MKKAIIFDLDGTLWETIDSTCSALNDVAKKYKQKEISKDLVCSNYGNNKVESAELFFSNLNQEEAFKLLDEADRINIENLTNNGDIYIQD